MVRTLVLTVDRDNGLGVKAGIRGPVIGRKPTLTAALRLGIADPEESDTNAILGALHHHDRLVENAQGDDEIEIALLTATFGSAHAATGPSRCNWMRSFRSFSLTQRS